MPTEKQYAVGVSANGILIHSSRYGSLRLKTKLKECYIVGYADDFRLFCKTKDSHVSFGRNNRLADWLGEITVQ